MKLAAKTQSIITIGSLLVLGMPLAFILTMLLFPFWGWFETLTGVEAMGHSGPAGWCYLAVYSVMLVACFIGAHVAIKRASIAPSSSDAVGIGPGATRKPE